LHGKLRPQIENIQSCAKDVKRVIALTKATSDRKEAESQEQERKLAAKHRRQMSIFASRSLESAREWQMQRNQELSSNFQGLSGQSCTNVDREKEKETPGLLVNVCVPNKFQSESQKATS